MSYTIIDLLDKFILIEQNGHEMFMKMASSKDTSVKIKALVRVFANEEKRHMEIYKHFKEEISEESIIEIDFSIYDKALKLIYEFSRYNRTTRLDDTTEVLKFCLNFEKENLALALSIQGILVKSQNDIETENYKILENIINEEKKHIENIEAVLKKRQI